MSPDALSILELQEGSDPSVPWEIPSGWAWQALGDIANVLDHRRVPINSKQRASRCAGKAKSELFPYYGATGQVGWIDGFLFEGDHVLLGEDGAPFLDRTKPKAYLASGRYWVNNHAHILETKPAIELRWLLHALNWANYEEFVGGTTRLKLTRADLIKIPIPVAPLREQQRIVARIDELFAEIAEGEAALDRARQGLDTWRRALLKAAVTGELTRDWREANPSAKTRSRSLGTWGPYAIPISWIWTTVGEAGQVLLGRQRAPQHHSGPNMRPYLRVANVLEDRIDRSDIKFMNFTPSEFQRYHLQPGDILLNEGQSLDLVGRSAIYKGEIKECCFQKTLLRFRAYETLRPEYAQIVFLHYLHSKRFRRAAPITTNMAHLTLERLLPIEFPLPPREEQTVIIHRCRQMWDTIHDMDSALEDRHRDALRQAILKAAFEGRLVPQDPADEPASPLLAQARNTHHGNGARRRRGRAAAGFSRPSLPGLTGQSVDPRVEPAGDV